MTIDAALPRAARFSIGRVLRDSFVIFGRNILLFGSAAVAVRLLSLLSLLAPASVPDPVGGTNWLAFCAERGLELLISGLTEAAIVFAAFRSLRGHRATARDVMHGMRSALPIVLAGVIYGIPQNASDIIEAMFPGQALIVVTWRLIATVGAIFLGVMWWVYVPAIAIEGKSVFASFGRSAELTKGRRWSIVGVFVLFTITIVVPLIVVVLVTDVPTDELTAGPLTLVGVVGYVFYALTTVFFTVLVTVGYFYLRLEKEGSGVEDIVGVFD